ncbi:helix-turn-helix transcriptional regulator [Actinocrinis puniceicyclus]|uniref:Helix-turn-helix transcriptional regulator n=1 Tax=Actinocrinis puniceicyclus TaxID=977794 RepID=A0A8J7WK64_9ACTN|nr:metalloregulator ArsR/SmtB family transcription factor [Actinocrinis puniceicyclus]MBS2963796.1 helix-turn-helix transcriptional regulator [Actinocrinis puniceicyclus]
MHLVPAEHAHRRTIDGHRVCEAIEGVGDPAAVRAWAQRFALLSDPGRLTLLRAIRRVPGISVSDLAVAAGMNDTAVSQALRLLRVAGAVAASKDGRIVRYRLVDQTVAALLDLAADRPDAANPGTAAGPVDAAIDAPDRADC